MMMKSIKWAGALCLMATALTFTACNKQPKPTDKVKSNGLPQAGATKQGGDVAFIDIDSLATQYDYCKESQKTLEAKQKTYSKQLNQKMQSLQNAMMAYQKKGQEGRFTSQSEVRAEEERLQKQQQQLQQFQEKIRQEMQTAAQNYQQVLRDSINSYLKDYNKDGRFKMILCKSDENMPIILYADKSLDITADVVAGLNKRYSKK